MEITWTKLWPAGADIPGWSHSGIAVWNDCIVFAEPGGGALVMLDQARGIAERIPTPTADAHGITATHADGRSRLWIADPGPGDGPGRVLAYDIGTKTFTVIDEPGVRGFEPRAWRPTSVAVVSEGERRGDVWIADGYGRSLVHRIGHDGSVLTVDGEATGRRFDCPHGIAIDQRRAEPRLVIADRSNRRLVVLDLEGKLDRVVADPMMTSPSSLAIRGSDLLITDLHGALLRLDFEYRVDAVIPAVVDHRADGWPNAVGSDGAPARPHLVDGVLNSPHGIAVGADGAVYLTEWLIGGRQLRLDFLNEVGRAR